MKEGGLEEGKNYRNIQYHTVHGELIGQFHYEWGFRCV